MASKSKAARAQQSNLAFRKTRILLTLSAILFIVKMIVLINIPGHVWLGADGENYITGLNALNKDGIFSTEHLLSYWPAGYPLLMLIFSKLILSQTLVITLIFQSALFSFTTWYFSSKLLKTKLSNFATPALLFLNLNPTLSLSTLTVGYESISASIFLISITLFLGEFIGDVKKFLSKKVLIASVLLSFSSFLQPRFFLTSLLIFLIWGIALQPRKLLVGFLVILFSITSLLPGFLIFRNIQANHFVAVSTNLGITMNLGAGPGATGAYIKDGYGVPCPELKGNEAERDAQLRNCVISWYLKNPGKSAQLFFNKAKFFWSPWSGPEASGSMARNPWLKFNPLVSIAKQSPSGYQLVYGGFGKLVSWVWMIGLIVLTLFGFYALWSSLGIYRYLGLMSGVIVLSNWLVSVGTLGDHRQRLPIMTISLFLQLIGLGKLVGGKKYKLSPTKS